LLILRFAFCLRLLPYAQLFPYTTLFRSWAWRLAPLSVVVYAVQSMKHGIRVAPSILAADFLRLGQEIEAVDAGGADAIHVFDLQDRKSTRLNSSHVNISYAVFCLNKNKR